MREATLEEYRILSAVIRHIREVGEDYWENPATHLALVGRWTHDFCSIQCRLEFHKETHRNSFVLSTNGWTYHLNNKVDINRYGSILVHDTDERLGIELVALKMAV